MRNPWCFRSVGHAGLFAFVNRKRVHVSAKANNPTFGIGASADYADNARKRAGEMPPGCDCAGVVLGKIYPNECRLYGKACVPRNPIGPCMVSDEGACRIWWSAGVRENLWEGRDRDAASG